MNYLPSNVDRNVSSLEIARLVQGRGLAISKVFFTIQGEMPFAGRPAVFVRLAGCNRGAKIDCPFCDTEFSLNRAEIMSPAGLVDEIMSMTQDYNIDELLIVISGGEPTLQIEGISSFVKCLEARIKPFETLIQFETNGDYLDKLAPFGDQDEFEIVISPKASPTAGHNESIGELLWGLPLNPYVRCVVSADQKTHTTGCQTGY